jgi:hypothetical protein
MDVWRRVQKHAAAAMEEAAVEEEDAATAARIEPAATGRDGINRALRCIAASGVPPQWRARRNMMGRRLAVFKKGE